MGNSMEFISNHPVLSVALFIFIYLIISFEIKNFTKKYKSINCNDLVQKINEENIIILDTREKSDFKKGHISNATNYEISLNKKFRNSIIFKNDTILFEF